MQRILFDKGLLTILSVMARNAPDALCRLTIRCRGYKNRHLCIVQIDAFLDIIRSFLRYEREEFGHIMRLSLAYSGYSMVKLP